MRDGLRGMFSGDPEFEVVGEAADGAEGVACAERLLPHHLELGVADVPQKYRAAG